MLDEKLNRPWCHLSVLILVLLDSWIVVALLLIDLRVIQAPPSSNTLQERISAIEASLRDLNTTATPSIPTYTPQSVIDAENALSYTNVAILSIFLVEITLRVFARGPRITKDMPQIVDCLLVLVVFISYISLAVTRQTRARNVIAFFILLRLWRITRLFSSIGQPMKRKAEQVVNTHRKARKLAEEKADNLQDKIDQQEVELGKLKQTLVALKAHNATQNNSTSVSDAERSVTPDDVVTEFTDQTTLAVVETVIDEISPQKNTSQLNGSIPSVNSSSSLLTGETVETKTNPSTPNGHFTPNGTPGVTKHCMNKNSDVNSLTPNGTPGEIKRNIDSENVKTQTKASLESLTAESGATCERREEETGEGNTASADAAESSHRRPATIKDSKQLLADASERKANENFAYLNPAFVDIQPTQEELSEIKRISNVPFMQYELPTPGATIPMTDL